MYSYICIGLYRVRVQILDPITGPAGRYHFQYGTRDEKDLVLFIGLTGTFKLHERQQVIISVYGYLFICLILCKPPYRVWHTGILISYFSINNISYKIYNHAVFY